MGRGAASLYRHARPGHADPSEAHGPPRRAPRAPLERVAAPRSIASEVVARGRCTAEGSERELLAADARGNVEVSR